MDVALEISKLKSAEQTEKLKLYENLIKKIYDLQNKDSGKVIEHEDMQLLLLELCNDLSNELFVESILKQLKFLLKTDKNRTSFLSDEQKIYIIKSIVCLIKVSSDDKVLLLCFEHLDSLLTVVKLTDDMIEDLLSRLSEITNTKSVSIPLYLAVCNYIQKFFKEYNDNLTNLMHIIPKLVFPPLSHSFAKIREVADKTLDNFPKLLLYAENEAKSNALLKLIKDAYCKELLSLFKEKHEAYVLKVWNHIVNSLGTNLHRNLPAMTPLFQIIERGFKSTSDDVCKLSFISWKCLISNFALEEAVLNDSKKLRFILKPFKNLSKFNETISVAVCDTWWHLAWSLDRNLSSRFTEVCIPLLEFTIGKVSAGSVEKAIPKGTHAILAKRGCHFLLRLLEQPPNATFSRLSSPKKLPTMLYPALQAPLDPKVLIHHSKEIVSMVQSIIESFGNTKEMTSHLDSLLKSILFLVSTVIDDRNKDSIEAVISLINLVSDITESRMCPPLTCLKCIDSLSKLPRSILVSHCFNCGPRKPQDILCTTLLKLLMNPYLSAMETPHKKFLMAYNRLIQAGLCESLNPLLMTHKYIHIVKSAVLPEKAESEMLYEIWSGIASPLLDFIEKTQEVNQGDKQEHDFSCLYDVLLCPFEQNFPVSMHQLRTKPAFRLWTNLYKTFIRSSSLVTTVQPNEACEQFCCRLKNYFKDDLLKEPQHFESMCFILEVVIDSVDFTSIGASNSQGFANGTLLAKRKKPLGNLTSLLDLLMSLLQIFYSNYINVDEDIYQSCTPKAQRKGHIIKTGVPFDLIKTFLGNLKSGSIFPFVLEGLALPLSKSFAINPKKYANTIGVKLEDLWNVMTSAIEIHYLGPYDSDFLTILNPLLESCISHPRRLIKERSRRFWFATFAPSSSSLKMTETLKIILKKSKLSTSPEENISSLEDFSFTPDSTSLENGAINFESAITFKEPFSKPFALAPPKEAKPALPKAGKSSVSTSKSVDELPIDEFVKIDSPSSLNTRRRSIRHRKSFVPALYNDLSQSQDTTTLGGSSESFDTSSSCEIIEFKSQEAPTSNATLSENLNHLFDGGDVTNCKLQQEKTSVEVITDSGRITTFGHIELENVKDVVIESEKPIVDKIEDNKQPLLSEEKLQENISKPICMDSDVKESIDEIVHKVSMANSVEVSAVIEPKRSDSVRQMKRNAFEILSTKNAKKSKKILEISEPIQIANTELKTTILQSITTEFPVNQCDTIMDDLNNHCKQPDPVEKTLKTVVNPINKASNKKSRKDTKKNASETFALSTSNKGDQSVCKPNQTCPDIIDLGDSEEIIPSSQSSGDSVSYINTQTSETVPKKSSRRSLKFDNLEEKIKTSKQPILVKIQKTIESMPQDVEHSEQVECPETPLDLMGAFEKKSVDLLSQECVPIVKDSEPMPLKSSENLLICEDVNNKSDSNEVKSVLSTVLSADTNKVNVAENTPPFSDEVCVLQSTEHVSFQSSSDYHEGSVNNSMLKGPETKISKSESMLNSSSGTEESPKTMRVKSLRSAGRKSLDSATKKVVKRTGKRKSMSCINEAKKLKCNMQDTIPEEGNSEGMSDMDDLPSSHESASSSISDSDKLTQKKAGYLSEPPQTVEFEKEENSFLMEITKVVSDIQEKLESYEDSCAVEFSLNEKECQLPLNQENSNLLLSKKCENILKDKEHAKKNKSDYNHESSEIQNNNFEASQAVDLKMDFTNDISDEVESQMQTTVNSYSSLKPCIQFLSAETIPNVMEISQNISDKGLLDSKATDEISESSNSEHPKCLQISSSISMQNNDKQVDLINVEIENSCQPLSKIKQIIKSEIESDAIEKELKEDKNPSLTLVKSETIETAQTAVSIDFNEKPNRIANENFKESKVFNLSEKVCDKLGYLKKETSKDLECLADNELNSSVKQDIISPKSTTDTVDIFDTPDILVCPNVLSNYSSIKYDFESIKPEHCSDVIAAYEEIDENLVDGTDKSEHLKPVNSEEQFKQNLSNIKCTNYVENEFNDHLENHPNLELINVIENSCPSQNSQEVKSTESVYDENNDVFLVVASEANFTENSVEISDVSSAPIIEDANVDTISISNNDNVEMVVDTPNLLTSETFENDSDNRSDDLDYVEMISSSKLSRDRRVHAISKKESTENTSRKRKAKQPVRSPFLFRQRSNILMAKNFPINCEPIPMDVLDTKNSKRTINNVHNKLSENGIKKQKIMNRACTSESPNKLVTSGPTKVTQTSGKLTVSTQDIKKAIETVKSVNYDELTNMNTRFNASMTFRTRRYEMLAASQNVNPSEERSCPSDEKDLYPQDEISSSKSSSGILKKKRMESDPKGRKVTFADPLVEERLFKNDDALGKSIHKNDFLIITKEQPTSNYVDDVEKISKAGSSRALAADEVTSSNEYQNSDNLTDYNTLPVSPLLINCEESVSSILKGLTSPTWIRGLETLLLSKNINTIGDLCKLNVHELKALPFKSPKVVCLHKALVSHLTQTQRSTLDKLKAVDDWCSTIVSSENKPPGKEADSGKDEGNENLGSEVVQSLAGELLNNDQIKKLPTETLILLAKKCFSEVTERLEKSK